MIERTERIAQLQRVLTCQQPGCSREFKNQQLLAKHLVQVHNISASGDSRPLTSARTHFQMVASPLMRLARRMCASTLKPRHLARRFKTPISSSQIKANCQEQIDELRSKAADPNSPDLLVRWMPRRPVVITKPPTDSHPSSSRLNALYKGSEETMAILSVPQPDWLKVDKPSVAPPERLAFPRPPREQVDELFRQVDSYHGPSIMMKRGYETLSTPGAPPTAATPTRAQVPAKPANQTPTKSVPPANQPKRSAETPTTSGTASRGTNSPAPQPTTASTGPNSPMPAGVGPEAAPTPNEVVSEVFRSSTQLKALRNSLQRNRLRQLARKPWVETDLQLGQSLKKD